MTKYLLVIAAGFTAVLVFYFFRFNNPKPLCANNCRDSFELEIEEGAIGIFNKQPVNAPNIVLKEKETEVLGSETSDADKRIYVNLTAQTITAYEGKKLFMKTLISSGLWGRTPTGDFTIWTKLRATRMRGGEGADYYDLPNVPYVMFFSNNEVPASAGFSLHGAYWHNNFGHKMSHGCINMKTTDAGKLFNWVDKLGTKVTIFEEKI